MRELFSASSIQPDFLQNENRSGSAHIFEGIAVIKSEAIPRTDGVGFLLEIKDAEKVETLFSTFLN